MATDANSGIYLSLMIAIGTMGILLLIFEIVVRLVPRVFRLRENLSKYYDVQDVNGKPIWFPPYQKDGDEGRGNGGILDHPWMPLKWLWYSYQVREYEIARYVSVDAVMFLKFMKTQAMLYVWLTIITFVILVPTYATGPNKNLADGDQLKVDGVLIITMANLETGDNRLWVTWIVEVIITLVICIVSFKDFARYAYYARKFLASRSPSNFAILIQDIPDSLRSTQKIYEYFDRIFPDQIAHAIHAENAPVLVRMKLEFDAAVMKKELAMYKQVYDKTQRPPMIRPKLNKGQTDVVTENGLCGPRAIKEEASEYWYKMQGLHFRLVHEAQQEPAEYLLPTNSALVVFRTIHAASQAVQSQLWFTASEMFVMRAPEPLALNWGKLSMPRYVHNIIYIISTFLIIGIIVVWGALSVGISALSNLTALSQISAFSWLAPVLSWPDWLVGFIEGFLPPFLLAILASLVPIIFRVLVSLGRYPWIPAVDRMVRDYYYAFLYLTSFWAILISGSIFSQLNALIANPNSVLDLLANSLPAQSNFFLILLIQRSFIFFSMQLVQVPRLVIRSLVVLLARPKTERQWRKLDRGLGSFFLFFKVYAIGALTSLIALVYSSIAPLLNVLAVVYFTVGYFVCKYCICYTQYRDWQDGGRLYRGAFWMLMVNMFTKQISMIALFSVFKQPAIAALQIINLLISMFAAIWIYNRFENISVNGSLMDVFDAYGKTIGKEDEVAPRYISTYVFPGLKKLNHPENLTGCSEKEIEAIGKLHLLEPNTGEDEEKTASVSALKEKKHGRFKLDIEV